MCRYVTLRNTYLCRVYLRSYPSTGPASQQEQSGGDLGGTDVQGDKGHTTAQDDLKSKL